MLLALSESSGFVAFGVVGVTGKPSRVEVFGETEASRVYSLSFARVRGATVDGSLEVVAVSFGA